MSGEDGEVEVPDDDEDNLAGEAPDPCGLAAPLVEESTEALACASGVEQVAHLPFDAAEEVEHWPRRVRARRIVPHVEGEPAVELMLFYPEAEDRAHRQIRFTKPMFERWYTARGESRQSSAVATWGTPTPLTLRVSKLVGTQLVFDPLATDADFPITVYNLDASQPKWRRLLERSFAILPISHLRAVNLKSVFLDFHVGTNRIGPEAIVADGGTNWKLGTNDAGEPSAPDGIDPAGCSAVCATYAALNRAWGERDVHDIPRRPRRERATPPARPRRPRPLLPASEQALDDSFDNLDYVQFTFYHELGHLFDYGGNTAAAGAGRNALWGRFRDALHYVGESNGVGEGFAEGYRYRMLGLAFAQRDSQLTPELTTQTLHDMNVAFDAIGMPSLGSVQAAWTAIRAHFGAR